MTPKRQKRLALVVILVVGVGAAVALAVTAFRSNMLYFFTPTQIAAGEAPGGHAIRLGGMVGNLQRAQDSLKVQFDVTDYEKTITVHYEGILPDLFREGQGVIAIGELKDGHFFAKEVLAKHDENYMPPEVAASLKTAKNETTGD